MGNQQKEIAALRSKETFLTSNEKRWRIKKTDTTNVWLHYDGYTDEYTTCVLEKENKRGFTFVFYFAGKYIEHFISRGDCDIIYRL